MVHLEPDPFLTELTKLYEKSKTTGSVWVTMKRSNLKPKPRKQKGAEHLEVTDEELRCLIRATDGKKNISTSVTAKDHIRFQTSYATVLKAHMDALKKKEKKEKKKSAPKPVGA